MSPRHIKPGPEQIGMLTSLEGGVEAIDYQAVLPPVEEFPDVAIHVEGANSVHAESNTESMSSVTSIALSVGEVVASSVVALEEPNLTVVEGALLEKKEKLSNKELQDAARFNRFFGPVLKTASKLAANEDAFVAWNDQKQPAYDEEGKEYSMHGDLYWAFIYKADKKMKDREAKKGNLRVSPEMVETERQNTLKAMATGAKRYQEAAESLPGLRESWDKAYWDYMRVNYDVTDALQDLHNDYDEKKANGVKNPKKVPTYEDLQTERIDVAYFMDERVVYEDIQRGMYPPRMNPDGSYMGRHDTMREVGNKEAAQNRKNWLAKLADYEMKRAEQGTPQTLEYASMAAVRKGGATRTIRLDQKDLGELA